MTADFATHSAQGLNPSEQDPHCHLVVVGRTGKVLPSLALDYVHSLSYIHNGCE